MEIAPRQLLDDDYIILHQVRANTIFLFYKFPLISR